MDELYYKCREIVIKNTCVSDLLTIDILTISILALVLDRGQSVIRDIPGILSHLRIISDERTPAEVYADERAKGNFTNDMNLDDTAATVIRRFDLILDFLDEKRLMIIPQKGFKTNPIRVIETAIHELTHLLRFGDGKLIDGVYRCHEGVVEKTLDFNQGRIALRNEFLEEAIVQQSTLHSLYTLFEHLDDCNVPSPILRAIKFHKTNYNSNIYSVLVFLLNGFCEDMEFSKLVDDTFDSKSYKKLALYFNHVMDDDAAFLKLSKAFDNTHFTSCCDEEKFRSCFNSIDYMLKAFNNNRKTMQYKKEN